MSDNIKIVPLFEKKGGKVVRLPDGTSKRRNYRFFVGTNGMFNMEMDAVLSEEIDRMIAAVPARRAQRTQEAGLLRRQGHEKGCQTRWSVWRKLAGAQRSHPAVSRKKLSPYGGSTQAQDGSQGHLWETDQSDRLLPLPGPDVQGGVWFSF